MIKRLIIIAAITGLAHVFTVIVLRQLGSSAPISEIGLVGETDSMVNLIISIIAGGLLMSSVRDLATSENWQSVFIEGQRARLTLALYLLPLALISFFLKPYFIFMIGPIIALNGDYLLYGRGKPVMAAILSFLKVFVPSLAMLLAISFAPDQIALWYTVATIIIYFFCGAFVSYYFKLPYWISPASRSLNKYLSSMNTGIVAVTYYFMGLGIIALGGSFYAAATIAVAYIAIKIHVIYKGVLRIVTQSFFKEMTDDAVCLKIDMIGTLCGLAFFMVCVLFSTTVSNFFFEDMERENNAWIVFTAITGLTISPFISLTSRVLLDKKDRPYAKWSLAGVGVSVTALLAFRVFSDSVYSVLLSLLLGELTIVAGLLLIAELKSVASERLTFALKSIWLLILPVVIRVMGGDTFLYLVLALTAFGIPAFILNRHRFTLTAIHQKNRI
jgi:hypothetical protein